MPLLPLLSTKKGRGAFGQYTRYIISLVVLCCVCVCLCPTLLLLTPDALSTSPTASQPSWALVAFIFGHSRFTWGEATQPTNQPHYSFSMIITLARSCHSSARWLFILFFFKSLKTLFLFVNFFFQKIVPKVTSSSSSFLNMKNCTLAR